MAFSGTKKLVSVHDERDRCHTRTCKEHRQVFRELRGHLSGSGELAAIVVLVLCLYHAQECEPMTYCRDKTPCRLAEVRTRRARLTVRTRPLDRQYRRARQRLV